MYKKSKGFTIVELVIVIAIVAILAAVLIPTFSSIIDKANQSSDIQAVRQMNMALAAESVETVPTELATVIQILAEAGYNSEDKLIPVSKNHVFYWYEDLNLILLSKEDDASNPSLIYPDNDENLNTAFNDAKDSGLEATEGFYSLADGSVILNYNDFEIDLLSAKDSITLTGDVTINNSLAITTDKEINLNNNILTINSGADLKVTSGTLKIKGGFISSTAEYLGGDEAGIGSANGAELVLENITFTVANPTEDGNPAVYCNAGSKATINNCTFNLEQGVTKALAIFNGEGSNMEITSCTFNYGSFDYGGLAPIRNHGRLELNQVSIDSGSYCFSVADSSSPVYINGGVYDYGKNLYNQEFFSYATITIEAATIGGEVKTEVDDDRKYGDWV